MQNKHILQYIKNRGPDYVNKIDVATEFGISISFFCAVLWMQGPEITKQPVDDDHGVLLYNGDIFDKSWNHAISDTQTISENIVSETMVNFSKVELWSSTPHLLIAKMLCSIPGMLKIS